MLTVEEPAEQMLELYANHVEPLRRYAFRLTSNRTRELHDALKRRCLYHWIDHPGLQREVEIVRSRLPEVGDELAASDTGRPDES